uniref:Cytochrome b5 heme-binding domain-containing protein n=1 Tax=Wuchereria bancrofti TaxID=6293 RepID=A0A1I8ENL0_WUCBA
MADLQRVIRAQVAEHNTSSIWMCIENQIYDLTTRWIRQACFHFAHDAIEQYEDIGHSTDIRFMKDKYLVVEILKSYVCVATMAKL